MSYPSPFSYLAFNETSQAILGHGFTAIEALSNADTIAPDAPIYILEAGSSGWKIWSRSKTLPEAKRTIEASGLAALCKRIVG